MKPITHRVQRANDASPLKQTRFKDALSKGKEALDKGKQMIQDKIDQSMQPAQSGPDYSQHQTFTDYKTMASEYGNFNPATDTVFVDFSLDGGVGMHNTSAQAREAAGSLTNRNSYTTRFFPQGDVKQYATTNKSGQSGITTLAKYNKEDIKKSVR